MELDRGNMSVRNSSKFIENSCWPSDEKRFVRFEYRN